MRKWVSALAGMLLVAGATFGFAQYMKSYELDVTTMETIKPVRMIQAGELITEDKLQIVSIPTVQHMNNAIIDASEIVGKRAVVPIGEVEEILSWKIADDWLYPKEGEQYVGFKADFVAAVNNMVRRGDKVDVWVDYTQPKWVNQFGEEIDQVLMEQQSANNPNSFISGWEKIFSKKLIDGLTVAYVKDVDGKEVEDVNNAVSIPLPGSTPASRDNQHFEDHRQGATNQTAYITFIMNDEQYEIIAKGTKEGTIKLGLPTIAESIGEIIPQETTSNEEVNAE